MYSIHNIVDITKIHKGYSMHVMFLLALLCCHLDIVAMEMDNESITPLPENFVATALTEDCVGSMRGCIFKKDPKNPVAYVSTLMFLNQKKKSEKNMADLQHIQDLLQANIPIEALAETQKFDMFTQTLNIFLCSLLDQGITQETKSEHVLEKSMQYACKGYIQLLKPQALYMAYFLKNENNPFQLHRLEKAELRTNILYHTQNVLEDREGVLKKIHSLGEVIDYVHERRKK